MSEARIEQRWAEDGEMSWCIIHGKKIIAFGEPDSKEFCEENIHDLNGFLHCRDFFLTAPPEPK